MTPQTEHAKTLRRVLYLLKILGFNTEDMKLHPDTVPPIKSDAKCLVNATNRLASTINFHSPKSWEQIKADISKEKLHDINILLDELMDVDNICAITEAVKIVKAEQVI